MINDKKERDHKQNMLKFSTSRNIDPTQLDNLFSKIGWKKRGSRKWRGVLSKSNYVYSAWDANALIGLGRIVEDGVMCMFYDIGVHPRFQNQGIGTKIMKHLITKVKNKKYASIGLFTWEKNPNNISFYQKFGFIKSSGMELVKYMKKE